jgi:hypothetical protein
MRAHAIPAITHRFTITLYLQQHRDNMLAKIIIGSKCRAIAIGILHAAILINENRDPVFLAPLNRSAISISFRIILKADNPPPFVVTKPAAIGC